ncbi:hypothetical protein D3C75_1333200 [compost metagenome]
MKDQQYRVASDLTVTDKIMKDTFWVGLWPGLGEDHLEHVADSIEAYVRRLR